MIEITVDTRLAIITNRELLTSGSVGIPVSFTLSEDWDGLIKTACFRNGDNDETQIDIALTDTNECALPHENCAEEFIDETVFAGIYGADYEGNIVIPTVWASLGALKQGVKPGNASGSEPTPDMWAQIQAIAMSAGEENAQAAAQSAEAASGSADDAAASATESAGYATAASGSADTASGYATAAGSSASDAADSATAAAVSAGDASTAQTAAETAQTEAETAQSLAETAQAAAEAAQAFLENASATATTLEPGSSATASYEDGVFTFGIPEGLKGDKGDTGATGQTGAQGPKGDKGDPGDPATNIVTSVNTQIGDVVLDAGDIAYEDTTVEDELTTINSALTSLSAVTEIIDTASGAIASFPDGSGLPMRSLLAQIEPQQEGSGDPSPENVRPITGWTGLSGWVEEEYDPTEQPTFSVNWQDEAGTVYGGTLDVVSGLLTVDKAVVDLGTLTYDAQGSAQSGKYRMRSTGTASTVKTPATSGDFADIICSIYKTRSANNVYTCNDGISITSGGDISIYDSRYNTEDSVASFTQAMDGVQLVYALKTPITYPLTPQQVSTLLGQNNVWHDANGDTTVTYQASIKGYIDKVLGQ